MIEVQASTRPSEAVLQAIAEFEGKDPLELGFRLYDYVEVDALDALVNHARRLNATELSIHLTIDSYEVLIRPDEIDVQPQEESPLSIEQ